MITSIKRLGASTVMQDKASTLSKRSLRFSCQHCGLRELCFPVGLKADEMALLDEMIVRQEVVKKGETLFQQGTAFSGFYVVRSGSFKYYQTLPTNEVKVLAFYLPGELFGLDAIHSEQHPATAEALEDSSYCVASFDELLKLSQKIATLQRYLLNVMSKRNCDNERLILHHHSAEQRLAIFLLRLSEHFACRGFSATAFTLSMSRKDIANCLDLANETISRIFKALHDDGLVDVQGKHVQINDLSALKALSESLA